MSSKPRSVVEPAKKEFKEDHSKSNPRLHLNYVRTAIEHLFAIDRALVSFGKLANSNMHGVTNALLAERKKLVKENAAYAEAEDIILDNRDNLKAAMKEWAEIRANERREKREKALQYAGIQLG